MAVSDISNTWENIRQGVKDAELLIGQKKYNLSMIKSRQVLELMVNYLCNNASISTNDLATSIDDLYDMEWINKTTCEHYHKIRMLGNKAVHEGNNNAYDANQCYHLLSKEVYAFANEYKTKQARSKSSAPTGTRSRRTSGNRGNRNRGTRTSGRQGSRSRRRQPTNGFSISPTDLIRIGLVFFAVLIIILAVWLLKPKKDDNDETIPSTDITSSEYITDAETFADPVPTTAEVPTTDTMANTLPAPVYKTTDTLNVRSEPSTAGEKLGVLEPGTIIDYVEDYDDEWTVINYNGRQAYVNSQYLAHD